MDCTKRVFYRALCFIILLVLKSNAVYANDSIEIKSTVTGQTIYEVIFESETRNTTDKAPGIYAVHRDGSVTEVATGTVLQVSKGFNGILAQTSQNATADTAESIAVVNGQLVLFNKNSSKKGATSKRPLTLGKGKFSIFDPILGIPYGSEVSIESLDDISIKSVENVQPREGLQNGGKLFLASVKKANDFGDGLTMAFIVENPKSEGSQPRIFQDRAVILGYRFINEKALDYLVVKYSSQWTGQLFSHNVGRATLQKLNAEEKDPLIGRWIKYMKEFVKKLESAKSLSEYSNEKLKYLRMGVPVFDMFTDQTVFGGIPARPLMKGDISLYQVFDPRTSLWSVVETNNVVASPKSNDDKESRTATNDLVFIDPNNLPAGSSSISGRVGFDNKKQYRVISLDPKNKDLTKSEYLIVVGDSTVVLLRDKDGKIKTLNAEDVSLSNARSIDVVHEKHETSLGMVHYLFMSITLKNNKQSLTVLTLKENEAGFHIVSNTDLMNKHVSRDEIVLRSKFNDSEETQKKGVYFDTSLPVKGAAHYRRGLLGKQKANDDIESASKKITPYFFLPLSTNTNNGGSQAFLRAAKLIEGIGKGVMTFLQFGDKKIESSSAQATGFYFDYYDGPEVIETETLNLGNPIFVEEFKGTRILGKPLYTDTSNSDSSMALDSLTMSPTKGASNVSFSLVPYLPNIKSTTTQRKFSVMLVASGETSGPSQRNKTEVMTVEIPADYDSLVGAQIVKGLRKKKDHFHILFFFGKNNSATQGLFLLSGKIESTKSGASEKYKIDTVHNGVWLHKESVNPAEIQRRLKADASGNFYWLENPEEPHHSLGLRGYDMANPSKLVYVNRDDQEHRRIQLRFDEELEDSKGKNSLHSKWHIMGRFDLFKKFSWFKEYVDKLNKKVQKESSNESAFGPNSGDNDWVDDHKQSNPRFISYLEKLAQRRERGEEPKRQVLLVEERMKETFLKDIMAQLVYFGNQFTVQINSRGEFEFYSYDVTSTLEEGQKEMRHIAEHAQSKPGILFAPIGDINSASPLVREKENPLNDTNPDVVVEEDDEPVEKSRIKEKLSRWLFLATNGQSSDTSQLRTKLKNTSAKIPLLIVGTPKEWNSAMEANPEETKKGVFDQFEVNSEFLTSSWMLWSPGSQYATPAVNEFAKTPVTEEEHRVFPDLESLFTGAATGAHTGKQKVLLVSEELKPLIHRLIMTRWTTASEKSKSPWHHSNEDLTVYQLQGGRDDNMQAKVFENFQAMRGGAEHSNVVFYSDLERISQLGRPFNNKGRTYKLRDPILGSGSTSSILSLAGEGLDLSEADLEKLRELTNQKTDLVDQIDGFENQIAEFKENGETRRVEELSIERDSLSQRLEVLQGQIDVLNPNDSTSESNVLPHLMWLIASEGNKIQPRSGRNWSLDSALDRKYSTILLGTEDEWNQIDQDLGSFESKYLDIAEHFDVVRLTAPSEEIKFDLVRSLFSRPEIESMGYSFNIPDQGQQDAKRQLISHFVNRVEQVAIQQNIESTTAFIRAFAELRHVLIEDLALRRSRTIDKNFLERLFFKIFPLPISIENLEADDPLHKVSRSVDEAARQLQRIGYHGSMDLKTRTFETLLSQTRGSDGGRPIPNSQIYFGGTSSGKTYLFKKKVEYLGLTEYDPSKASNEEADYIIISVQNLVDRDTDEVGKMTVDKAIEMVEDLMSQPKGHRAFILFDDAHKTSSKEVHQRLFTFIQSLFEAPNGVIRVRKKGTTDYKEVPVQNLNLYMTVNPTANKEQREKFAEGDNINKLVLAALASHNQDMEDSILARWSDIIDLDKFPRGAKVPALVERIRNQSKTSSSTVLVSPSAIDSIVNKFPNANAREFLIPAASALTRIPPSAERSSLYIVTERGEIKDFSQGNGERQGAEVGNGFLRSNDLNKAVRQLTEVDAIRLDEPASLLKLMNFLMSNFRMQAFNHMVLSAQNTDTLKLGAPGQTTVVQRNYIIAVMAHLLKNPQLPISEVRISGTEFSYLDPLRLEELVEIQQLQRTGREKPYFPFVIGSQQNFSAFHSRGFMESETLVQSRSRSRNDVFADTTKEIEQIFREMLKLYTRLPGMTLLNITTWDDTDRQTWFESLQPGDKVEEYKVLSNRLLAVYSKFVNDFYNPDLIEMKQPEQPNFTIYDQVRMFSYLVDKAITQLPWGLLSKFVLDVMDSASSDLSLGQKPHFINYAYTHQVSPLAIQTSDFLNETFAGDAAKNPKLEAADASFANSCSIFLNRGKE